MRGGFVPEICRSCKAPIRWATTDNGRSMPLDHEPDDRGEWQLAAALVRGGTPRVVHVPAGRRAELAGSLYMPHWATCPYADEHRR
jgi:hypothetical protein